jgi:hypothetical protein
LPELTPESIDLHARQALAALVRGDAREDVQRALENRFGAGNAGAIVNRAVLEYERLQRDGHLEEAKPVLRDRKVPLSRRARHGYWLVGLGVVATVVTSVGAWPGGILFFGPILYGGYLILRAWSDPPGESLD